MVDVYAITNNGQKGSLLGSTTTDSDGAFSLEIDNYDGPVLLEVTGGKYIDEATGYETDLIGILRASLPSLSGNVKVAITPLTEIAVRMAEAGGGFDPVKIQDANELISQLISANIISILPADSSNASKFSGASVDERNYALLLAAISQMSKSSGQDLATIIKAIEDDMKDLELNQTSFDLLTAIDDFLASEQNKTGTTDASGLVAIIVIIVDNGFQTTGDLNDAKDYLASFLKDPTQTNYDSLMYYMNSFVPTSAEAYLFKAMANLMDIYENSSSDFLKTNGLDLNILDIDTFDANEFISNLLLLATVDEDIAAFFAELESRLEDVYNDLSYAEGAKTFISLSGFDTIYLDDVDVKILKTITHAFQSACILVQAVNLSVDNWNVTLTSGPGTVDVRTLIRNDVGLTNDQESELLVNNPDLFEYSNLTKLASFRSAVVQTADDLQAVISALETLGTGGREGRVENAFNIDSDLDFYMAKAFSEETMGVHTHSNEYS